MISQFPFEEKPQPQAKKERYNAIEECCNAIDEHIKGLCGVGGYTYIKSQLNKILELAKNLK